MGNAIYEPQNYCLKFDRILDGENQIFIGIGENAQGLSSQVIRFGDYKNKYYRLQEFYEDNNKLLYKFEDNIYMSIENDNKNIHLAVTDPRNKQPITKCIDSFIIKHHKAIHLSTMSKELDKIYDLFEEYKKNNTNK